jgi:hypothetical protein
VLATVLALVLASSASAQSQWLERRTPHAILLEILKPDPEGPDGLSTMSSAWYLTGRMEFSPTVHGILELPFAIGDVETFGGFEEEDFVIGSPYAGVEFGSASSTALGELGVRLPLAGEGFAAPVVGFMSDTERWPAWFSDLMTVRAGLRVRSNPGESGLWVEGRAAPELWIGTGDFSGTEVWATYGAALRFDRPMVRAGAGVSGRISFPALDGQEFGDASLHQLDVAADFLSGSWRPGVSFRLPLDDDLKEDLSAVYGLSLTYLP